MRSKRLQRGIDDLVALLTIWWTMEIGNGLWAAYNYSIDCNWSSDSPRRVLWEETTGCQNCGTDVSVESAYCPSCGEDLEPTGSASADDDGLVCPECETVVTGRSRYCSTCGAKLADAMETSSPAPDHDE